MWLISFIKLGNDGCLVMQYLVKSSFVEGFGPMLCAEGREIMAVEKLCKGINIIRDSLCCQTRKSCPYWELEKLSATMYVE